MSESLRIITLIKLQWKESRWTFFPLTGNKSAMRFRRMMSSSVEKTNQPVIRTFSSCSLTNPSVNESLNVLQTCVWWSLSALISLLLSLFILLNISTIIDIDFHLAFYQLEFWLTWSDCYSFLQNISVKVKFPLLPWRFLTSVTHLFQICSTFFCISTVIHWGFRGFGFYFVVFLKKSSVLELGHVLMTSVCPPPNRVPQNGSETSKLKSLTLFSLLILSVEVLQVRTVQSWEKWK